ncbi:cache domain-containing protein [Massilia sp. PAMC28688]|uniref:cache domain-containing protein n=1 Tax=Massilia sp. PAMC28688 TaxID=2861283 RepID=UPI001C625AC5|nr:cache domain-containing protein [Massilia sp. PAMC28688]QYF95786.1 cache domain-containing protein [Massilia sp. PAMC28688]
MKTLLRASALCLAMQTGMAQADVEPTQKDAIAMVEKGAAMVKSQGKDEVMKRIAARDPEFVVGSLYLYARDLKSGVVLAHPINPAIVGKDLIDVPDTNGKTYRREIIELAAKTGKGWVDYTYKNPATGKIEPKTTYVLRVNDIVLEAGIYKK